MNKIKGSPNKSNSSESSKEKTGCEVVHFFTYWLGGKILPLTDKQEELVDHFKKELKHFSFVDVLETPLHWLVHGDFIEGSIIGQWNLKVESKIDKEERSKIYGELQSKKTDEMENIIKSDELSPEKEKQVLIKKGNNLSFSLRKFPRSQIIDEIFIPEDTFGDEVLEAISVKLFRTGVLSITIRWKIVCDCEKDDFDEDGLDCIADLIKGPEQTVRFIRWNEECSKIIEDVDESEERKENALERLTRAKKTRGELNVLSAECAKLIAKLFSEDLRKVQDNLKKQKVKYERIQVAWFEEEIKDVTNKTLSINSLVDNWKPGADNTPDEYINPYVGFIMEDLHISIQDLYSEDEKDGEVEKFCRQLITLSSTSPYYLKDKFVNPIEYVRKYNMARGEAIVIVDKRCIVTAGLSSIKLETMPLLAALGFSLECVFASTESIRRFITEIEGKVPEKNYKFNSLLSREYRKKFAIIESLSIFKELVRSINAFLKIISAARVLSPCDERITQVESYVASRTVIKTITELKKHQLDKLIVLARNKMITFSHLIETGHNFVSSEFLARMNVIIVCLTIFIALLTFIIMVDK